MLLRTLSSSNKIVYLPGLNGLRAIAALTVVIHHTTLELGSFNLDPKFFGTFQDGNPKGLDLAGFGVSIFFALSGFLITYLLLLEKKRQSINIKKFYIRRILRIWPIYYLYLLICILTILCLGYNLNGKSLLYYIFYAANIPFLANTTLPFLAHYWSLGVEEQFYLFWPWIVKAKEKYITPATLALIILLLGTKIYLHLFIPNTLLEKILDVTRFHCMLIGAFGAILYYRNHKMFLSIATSNISQLISWIIIALLSINHFHIASFIDNEIISCVSVVLIMGQITVKNRLINLELRWLDLLGKISYGMYVIHPLIIFFYSKLVGDIAINSILKYLLVYSLILTTTIIIAYLSYEHFEKRFLILKERFSIIKSSGTRHHLNR